MGIERFPAERAKHARHRKIGTAISGPRIAGARIMDMRLFEARNGFREIFPLGSPSCHEGRGISRNELQGKITPQSDREARFSLSGNMWPFLPQRETFASKNV